jgi:hypothetical protein
MTLRITVSGLCPSFGILNTRKHNVSKLDLFPSSGEGRQTELINRKQEEKSIV